jgi:hypothetical protein
MPPRSYTSSNMKLLEKDFFPFLLVGIKDFFDTVVN